MCRTYERDLSVDLVVEVDEDGRHELERRRRSRSRGRWAPDGPRRGSRRRRGDVVLMAVVGCVGVEHRRPRSRQPRRRRLRSPRGPGAPRRRSNPAQRSLAPASAAAICCSLRRERSSWTPRSPPVITSMVTHRPVPGGAAGCRRSRARRRRGAPRWPRPSRSARVRTAVRAWGGRRRVLGRGHGRVFELPVMSAVHRVRDGAGRGEEDRGLGTRHHGHGNRVDCAVERRGDARIAPVGRVAVDEDRLVDRAAERRPLHDGAQASLVGPMPVRGLRAGEDLVGGVCFARAAGGTATRDPSRSARVSAPGRVQQPCRTIPLLLGCCAGRPRRGDDPGTDGDCRRTRAQSLSSRERLVHSRPSGLSDRLREPRCAPRRGHTRGSAPITGSGPDAASAGDRFR